MGMGYWSRETSPMLGLQLRFTQPAIRAGHFDSILGTRAHHGDGLSTGTPLGSIPRRGCWPGGQWFRSPGRVVFGAGRVYVEPDPVRSVDIRRSRVMRRSSRRCSRVTHPAAVCIGKVMLPFMYRR